MKTAEEIFKEHCVKNSLFFSQDDTEDIIEAMKLYANQNLDKVAEKASEIYPFDKELNEKILSLKDNI